MKKYINYTFRLSSFIILISLVWGVSASHSISNKNSEQGHFIAPPDSTRTDTTLLFPIPDSQNPYDLNPSGGLYLNNPSNLKQDVLYDPVNNEYTVTNKIGTIDYRNPASFTFDEYRKWDTRRALDSYWSERANTSSGATRLGVIPQLRVGGQLFDKVFGGNTIDIRPQGSAELIFGVISNRRDDPFISQRLRRTTNFDFDMKIQMSVLAKIGDKIEFNTNYNTEATFDFENKLKLKYEGKEDEIIKLIEAGDVTMPINSSLITGSQSLFGLKTQMQFGKATVTTVFSQQKSQVENITVQGGAQTQKFSTRALDYEENRHFFMGQYFRDHYEEGLKSLPVITSNINITKIEVWVTNIGAAVTENRNILAFQDIGERNPYNPNILANAQQYYPDNETNTLLSMLDTTKVRNINLATEYLIMMNKGFAPGIDFEKIESARKLNSSEYMFNSRLGFLSLNTSLNPDQTLAVAYQYTVIGDDKVYQVGEFSDQGIPTASCLMVKLLKSTAVNTHVPLWKLMMKNVYNLGAYNINREDFIFNILYTGNSSAVPTGFFTEGPAGIKGIPLIQLFGLDTLDQQLNPPHDGLFDFLDNAARNGGTIQSSNGRIFFPVLEPFGSYLRNKINDKAFADKYCYDSLYTMTKTGAQQFPDKNKYLMEGQYKSESGSEISLNALNVPQGSVKVTAGGVQLVENSDYTVDYTLGRVKIINDGVLNSGTPINIQLENNSMLGIFQQTLLGTHVDYKVNRDLLLGATILNLYERPITQKTNYGDEPISNTIWGASVNYQKKTDFITKMVDKLPFYSTKTPSKLRVDAEFAQFIPGHSKAVGKAGTSYIDDFEGAKSTISLTNIASWSIASTPQGQTTRFMFPEAAAGVKLPYGYNRAMMSWYTIDPSVFYDQSGTRRPDNITPDELSRNSTRVVYENELFPNKENTYNQPLSINMFNVAYFPQQRGPYNFDVKGGAYSKGINSEGSLLEPDTRWGGMMRKMETSDFEAANVEYVTFWLMDPFSESKTALGQTGGDLYFNLGDISEDILRDGRKSYENGLPTSELITDVDTTIWGRVPTKQAITQSFDSKPESRPFQDVGYDGLPTSDEQTFFYANFLREIEANFGATSPAYIQANNDPSSDNFHSFVGSDFDQDPANRYRSVVERYKLYNGPDGNSPANESNNNTNAIGQRNPNVEDLNNDNTLSDQERYFQYVVHLNPDKMVVGENYITDVYASGTKNTDPNPPPGFKLENGRQGGVMWYQFKIPVQQPDKVIGGIQDYKSIRFMRMFLKNWDTAVVLRFASLELERGEWRKYYNSLLSPGEYIPDPNQDGTTFDISTLSVEENSSRKNVPYVSPPGIEREINVGAANYARMNEQAMVLKVCNLLDGDARGAFKTTDFDFRDYKNLKMYIHAEKGIETQELQSGELTAFIRFGSDFTSNYYEYEVPLTFTQWGILAADNNGIWPDLNNVDIELAKLVSAKKARNDELNRPGSVISVTTPFSVPDGNTGNKITIVGSPSMSEVRAMMVGVRNPKRNPKKTDFDDGQAKCAEIWINELRLTDFNEKSGWAANARVSTNLADLGNIMLSGAYSSPGFGSIEKKVTERQKEAITQFDIATNLELGKFLPEKSGIRVPVHYDYSQTISNPQYNPLDPDVLYTEQTRDMNKQERDSLKQLTTDVIKRQNLNFMNVRKDRVGVAKKPQIWDIENFDLSYAYSEISHHNNDVESDKRKTYRGGLGYNFAVNPKSVRPFQKIVKSNSLALLRDFNFYYIPKLLSFRSDMNRDYQRRLLRNKSAALIILEPNYTKQWDWNRIYDVKYDFSQSLKLDYSANVNSYINEPPGGFEKQNSNYEQYRDTVWNSIKNFGSVNRFNQLANVNYTVPFSKIPLLNWVTLSAKYGVKFRWEASPRSLQARFGNTIENSRDLQLNGGLRMTTLYDKVPFLKKARLDIQNSGQKQPGKKPGNEPEKPKGKEKGKEGDAKIAEEAGLADLASDSTEKPKKNYLKIITTQTLGVLMSIKDISLVYSKTNGTILPGFTPEPGPLGNNWNFDAPGLGFIFGSQKNITALAASSGWLTTDTLLNNPYITRSTENLNFRASLEPVRNLKIDVSAERAYSTTYQAYYKANSNGVFDPPTSAQDRGTFSMSYIIWPTAFKNDNANDISPVFEQMLSYRKTIAERLASENPNSVGLDSLGFPNGYGPTQPEVLLASFMAAYSGKDPAKIKFGAFPKIPYPNWRVTYNASQGIEFLRQYFQSFNVSHAYRSSYAVGGFLSDINFVDRGGFAAAVDDAKNFIPAKRMDAISVTEQFGPLIGIDITMKNSLLARLEYKKTRNLALSFVGNQLTEVRINEFVVGTGYRFKSVPFKVRSLATGKTVKLKSDLNVKLDFSIRDNKTLLRRIEEDNNQISTGTKQISINASADYMVSQKLNVRLFYDQTISKPHVSAQIPTSNTNAGISLRFTLAQ